MNPPYKITNKILDLISKISNIQGSFSSLNLATPEPQLRKSNRIKTIKGTLAIEGNTLNFDQITALLDGKKVVGKQSEIQEVINTNTLYDSIDTFKYTSIKDLLKSHKILMTNILRDAGNFRSKNVGILKGKKVNHIAPKPVMVPELIKNLFTWAKNDREVHFLIKSCILKLEKPE